MFHEFIYELGCTKVPDVEAMLDKKLEYNKAPCLTLSLTFLNGKVDWLIHVICKRQLNYNVRD